MFLLPQQPRIRLPTSAGHASAPHLMKMCRPERTFHTWPTAGNQTFWGRPGPGSAGLLVSMHVTVLLLARRLLCVSEWVVTMLAAARENEPSNACIGRYPIARHLGAVFRCFSSLLGWLPGRARLDIPCSKLLILSSRSSHPGLACVDMILTMLMLMLILLILHLCCGSDLGD